MHYLLYGIHSPNPKSLVFGDVSPQIGQDLPKRWSGCGKLDGESEARSRKDLSREI